jgi:hypothetical protein
MEYVLLMTAVVAVVIAMVTSNKSGLQAQLNSTLNTAIEDVGNMSDRLGGSEPASTGGNGNTTPPYTVSVLPGGNG